MLHHSVIIVRAPGDGFGQYSSFYIKAHKLVCCFIPFVVGAMVFLHGLQHMNFLPQSGSGVRYP